MSNLTEVVQQIKDEFKIDENGTVKASIRAVARLADVEPSSISRLLSLDNGGVALKNTKIAEMLAERGLEGVALSVALESWKIDGMPDVAVHLVLIYYGYEAGRHCTQRAKDCCLAFGVNGIRAWLHSELGWNNQNNLSKPTIAEIQSLVETMAKACHMGESRKAQLLAEQVAKYYPEMANLAGLIKDSCPNQSFEDEMINPDALLQKAIAFNILPANATRHELQMMLIHNGFQVENLIVDLSINHDKPFAGAESCQHMFGDSYYVATDKGKKFSKIVDIGKPIRLSDKTKELYWHPSVLNHLRNTRLVAPSYTLAGQN